MKYRLIEEDRQLPELLKALESSSIVGLDTEFVSEDCFRPDLCLVQVSTEDMVYIIDPREVKNLRDFWQMVVEPRRTVIVHAGREEILFVFRETGKTIPQLFDIQIALGILGGEYPASYANLLFRLLGESLDKGETRTDWRKRPLTASQLDYAALDVLDLPKLHRLLVEQLTKSGRLEWLRDELGRRQIELIDTHQREGWYRLGGIQSLRGRQLAIVRELWRWRERLAEQRNMPARRVLRDDLIVELARRGTSDPKRIASIRGLHHPGLHRMIPDLSSCIEKGLIADEPQLPWERNSYRTRPPQLLLQFLTAAMSFLCRRNQIATAIVGTSDDVRDLVTYWLNMPAALGARTDTGHNLASVTEASACGSPEASACGSPEASACDSPEASACGSLGKSNSSAQGNPQLPSLLVGWRGELIGKPLYDIFMGHKALRVQDPVDEMPLGLCDVPRED